MMLKRFGIFIILSLVAIPATVSSYFEYRYFCEIQQGSSITVSLNSGTQKCFQYLMDFQTLKSELQSDIDLANGYVNWGTDIGYRSEVSENLQEQKNDLEGFQRQIIVAINDFERSLFLQIKSLLQFQLSSNRDSVIIQLENLVANSEVAKSEGNTATFLSIINNIEQAQYKLFLLDRINFAHDFEELIPFLKEYMSRYGSL